MGGEEEGEEEGEAAAASVCTSATGAQYVPALCALIGLSAVVAGVTLVTSEEQLAAAAAAAAAATSSAAAQSTQAAMSVVGKAETSARLVVGRWLETVGAVVLAASAGGFAIDYGY
jgi:hypothetical protein